jgi:transposase
MASQEAKISGPGLEKVQERQRELRGSLESAPRQKLRGLRGHRPGDLAAIVADVEFAFVPDDISGQDPTLDEDGITARVRGLGIEGQRAGDQDQTIPVQVLVQGEVAIHQQKPIASEVSQLQSIGIWWSRRIAVHRDIIAGTAEVRTVLVGFDQDLAAEATRTSNRIRGLLTQFHPSLERVLGPRLDHQAVTWLLERYGSPAALRKAGRRRLVELIRPKAPRMAQRLIDDVFDALDEQTVVVPGTGTLDIVVPSLARSLAAVHDQRRALEAQINTLLEAHPLSPVLTSMPGVGVRTAAVLLTTVGDGTSFPSAAHLASYAGLAPTTKSSGTSIHGEHAPRGGNRQLKRAMFLSAFACMNADPASRTYYDKQRARGKTHAQALLRLARQRVSVLFAMLRDGTLYEPRTPADIDLAA